MLFRKTSDSFIVYPFRNSVIRPQYGVDDWWIVQYDSIMAFLTDCIRDLFDDKPSLYWWNYSFINRCLFPDRRSFVVAWEFSGNGLAICPDHSRSLIFFKPRRRGPWDDKQRMFRHHKEWMQRGRCGQAGMNFTDGQQNTNRKMVFCVLITPLEPLVMWYLTNYSKEELSVLHAEGQQLTCDIPISHRGKRISTWIAAGEELRYTSLLIGK